MLSRKWIVGLVIAGFFSMVLIDQLQSQQGGGRGRGSGAGQGDQGRGRGSGGTRFDPAQFQQRMMERMKETLQAGDDEWKVIEPRLSAVMTLSREVNSRGGMMGMFGRGRGGFSSRGGRGGPGGDRRDSGQDDRPQSDIEKCTQALTTLLEAENPDPAQIKKVLTALRTAREKAKQKLAKAQQNLRTVLTIRQEAQLVLMGYLQ
jgi:hypothetical protein